MAGWRVGMAVGNARLCAALARVKSYLDYGAFTPIQVAAVAALNGPQDSVGQNRGPTSRAATCWSPHGPRRLGHPDPQASMFAWAPVPDASKRIGSIAFSKRLIEEARGRGARRRVRRARRGLSCASASWRTSSASARPPAR